MVPLTAISSWHPFPITIRHAAFFLSEKKVVCHDRYTGVLGKTNSWIRLLAFTRIRRSGMTSKPSNFMNANNKILGVNDRFFFK